MDATSNGVLGSLGLEGHLTIAAACRLARRTGRTSVDAEALLLAILNRTPDLPARLEAYVDRWEASVAMARRAVPGGTVRGPVMHDGHLLSAIEDERLAGDLREIGWEAFGTRSSKAGLAWSPGVLDSLTRAVESTQVHGGRWVGVREIVYGLLDSPDSGISGLLAEASIEPSAVRAQVADSWPAAPDVEPYLPTVDALRASGIDEHGAQAASRFGTMIARLVSWFGRTTPVVACLESEAVRQAVRLEHGRVTSVHLLLAALSFNEQLSQLSDTDRLVGLGSQAVRSANFDSAPALAAMPTDVEESLTVPSRRDPLQRNAGNPPWSAQAARAAALAGVRARKCPARVHADVVVAAASTSDGAAELLRRLKIDQNELVRRANNEISLA